MRASRQAVTAAVALACINRLPPVTGPPDQVVALPCEFHQVMTMGKIAQPQKLWDGYIVWTGQAGTALTAQLMSQPTPALLLKMSECPLLLRIQRTVTGSQRPSQSTTMS